MNGDVNEWITLSEVKVKLQLKSIEGIKRACQKQLLPAVKKGHIWLVTLDIVSDYLQLKSKSKKG